ncbi:class I adenylate-forming enzyme family protein [Microlunatus sp. Gsoil 973]|uniref:class I adenylate-forming enzyme family protein n=1 Tax=Microlunatus sp. Gsoil 973 TaxID=2672569 RepID=UPI0012B4CDCF|nr:AMP-binding protein [Microlunatus sp. Gsoil 973]QGN33700.1 AMP-binding protein [Microlunatus sp. Gsoil 973]
MPYRYDNSAYRATFDANFTYLAGFWRNVRRFGDRPALIDPGSAGSWTYAELGDVVARLAQGLADRGVGPGDVVTYQLFNSAEFAQLYLAIEHLGAIACPINFRFSPGETAHVLDDSVPRVFIYDATLAESTRTALELADHRPGVLVAVSGEPGIDGAERYEDLPAEPGLPTPYDKATAWDESLRLYTSGTTGMPKGVSLPNAAEVLSAHDVIMHFPLAPQDKTMNMTPWFHRGGISSGGPQPVFYVGAASVILKHFDADLVLDLVQQEGLTFLIGAPTNLALLAAAQEKNPRNLQTLHGIVTMGAPLERAACLRYQEVLTPRIFNGYGTTEAFWNTFLRPADLPDHAGSAGQACTDDDVRVVNVYEDRPADPDDLAVKDGATTGEVIMRSLKSGYAYVNKADEQQAKFRDGWLYSGDLGTWDEAEFVTIAGRKDDMIISGGENVHPVQVEEVLNEHPGVVDSIVVGLPDDRWGEVVVAYVQPSDAGLTATELDKHCLASPMLADFKRPRRYGFVDDLPRTATGKKMHYVLRGRLNDPAVVDQLHKP